MVANLGQAFGASVGVAMVVVAILWVRAFFEVRIGFGRYLKRAHPEVWRDLVASRAHLLHTGKLYLDASKEMSDFRTSAFRDLGDPALSLRRVRANRAERAALISVFALFGWGLLGFAAISLAAWLRPAV